MAIQIVERLRTWEKLDEKEENLTIEIEICLSDILAFLSTLLSSLMLDSFVIRSNISNDETVTNVNTSISHDKNYIFGEQISWLIAFSHSFDFRTIVFLANRIIHCSMRGRTKSSGEFVSDD